MGFHNMETFLFYSEYTETWQIIDIKKKTKWLSFQLFGAKNSFGATI